MTAEQRKAIDPEYCAKGLQKAICRLGFLMENKELAAMYGAISILLDKPMEEWLFGQKDGRESG